MLSLVLYKFVPKYVSEQHSIHLFDKTKKYYGLVEVCTGALYCGIKIYWEYRNWTFGLSMPGYIYNSRIIVLMKHSKRDLYSGIVKEYTNTQWTPRPWINSLAACLYGGNWNFWAVKIKMVWIFIVICPITYSCLLDGYLTMVCRVLSLCLVLGGGGKWGWLLDP